MRGLHRRLENLAARRRPDPKADPWEKLSAADCRVLAETGQLPPGVGVTVPELEATLSPAWRSLSPAVCKFIIDHNGQLPDGLDPESLCG
jgi:hypothetical protein